MGRSAILGLAVLVAALCACKKDGAADKKSEAEAGNDYGRKRFDAELAKESPDETAIGTSLEMAGPEAPKMAADGLKIELEKKSPRKKVVDLLLKKSGDTGVELTMNTMKAELKDAKGSTSKISTCLGAILRNAPSEDAKDKAGTAAVDQLSEEFSLCKAGKGCLRADRLGGALVKTFDDANQDSLADKLCSKGQGYHRRIKKESPGFQSLASTCSIRKIQKMGK